MLKKMSARRRAAFLRALEATGNVTLAAERAGVSRSWVLKERRANPEFDAQCEAALAGARERLGAAEGSKGQKGWGHLDGAVLVVRGTGGSGGGKRVQIARARAGQITPAIEDRFLAALAMTCNVKAALAEAGISKGAAYSHRRRWPRFAERWDDAVADGYARLSMGLVEHGQNMFSSTELYEGPTPELALKPMTFAEVIHLLHMHKNGVLGIGRAPGVDGPRPRRPLDEVMPSILRTIDAVRRKRGMSGQELAKEREMWALRRGSGQAPRRRA